MEAHKIPDAIEFRPTPDAPPAAPDPPRREPPTAADITAAINAMRAPA